MVEMSEKFESVRMYLASRLTAGAIGLELAKPFPRENSLAEDRAGRVAGAEEERVEGSVSHRTLPVVSSRM
jgi:hypothetical protein